jgi:predicted PurR-regulated permease PerM
MNAPPGLQSSDISRLRLPLGNAFVARTYRGALIAGLGVIGVYLCFRLTVPFFTPLAAALVLAVLFAPAHRWIGTYIKRPSAAALVSVLLIASFVLAVLVFLTVQLVREAAAGAVLVRAAFEGGLVQQLLNEHPRVAPFLKGILDQFNAAGLAADAATWLTNMSATMLRGSVVQMAGVLLTFYMLFYFLRDRTAGLAALRSFLPFTEAETTALFASAVDTVHATVYGMVVTGALLGLFGGAIFAFVGLPAPVLWGSVMAVFAILPVLGTAMIWIPAAGWLALNGEWAGVAVVTLAFTGLSLADSVIYPYLVGNRMRMHTAIAFVAAIGGLLVFGPVGFIVGPMVIALVIALRDVLGARAKLAAMPAAPARGAVV